MKEIRKNTAQLHVGDFKAWLYTWGKLGWKDWQEAAFTEGTTLVFENFSNADPDVKEKIQQLKEKRELDIHPSMVVEEIKSLHEDTEIRIEG